jgi:hypothetical protein
MDHIYIINVISHFIFKSNSALQGIIGITLSALSICVYYMALKPKINQPDEQLKSTI